MRWTDPSAASPAEIALLDTTVTLQNFYRNIHYSHTSDAGDEAQRFTPNGKSTGSEAKTAVAMNPRDPGYETNKFSSVPTTILCHG